MQINSAMAPYGAQYLSVSETAENLAKALQPITSRVRIDRTAIKNADGKQAWTKDKLTPDLLLAHVVGGLARGVCPIKAGESTTRLALLDLDSHKGETPWEDMAAAAEKVATAMEEFGLRAIPFRSSGGKGIHLFALWDEPQDVYSVRACLWAVLASVGFKDGCSGVKRGEIEVFPKQNAVPLDGCGSQFILPLAGKSEPLNGLFGLGYPMGRAYTLVMDWPMSRAVAPRAPHQREVVALHAATAEPIERIRAALDAIPNDGDGVDYDTWRNLAFAVHEAAGGADDGRDVFADWSAKSSKHDPNFLETRVWPYICDADCRDNTITRASLFSRAREFGWIEPATADGLPEIPDSELATVDPQLPALERAKTGRPKATTSNLFDVLAEPVHAGFRIGLDNFRDEIMRAPIGTEVWRRFGDADYVALCIHLTKGPLRFEEPARDKLRDVVHAVAQQNRFDSAILWLEGLPVWDGVPRVDSFFSTYGGVDNTPYTRAVGAYLWTALAGRVLVPGCKADMVPVLSGPQGFRKSSLVAAIPPDPEFFAEIDLAAKDDDTARLLRGKLVGELPELKGMRRREVEAMKAFITKQHEHWIPKYREFETTFPRRLIFVGTTNESEFLQDETGNRRWLPLTVTRPCDPEGVARDRNQLWTEAAARFKAGGVAFLEAERLALAEHDSYLEHDAWTDRIANWLSYTEIDPAEGIGTDEIAVQVLGIDAGRINRDTQGRIGRAMKNVPGFIKKKIRRGGVPVWRYVRK
jgi:hypothetical protein